LIGERRSSDAGDPGLGFGNLRRVADISSYGDASADIYDEFLSPPPGQELAIARFLAGLAPGGQALELGVGTGRVALPLTARGLRVHGIEGSTRMLARMRDKPGGNAIQASVGDFADVNVPGLYDLVFIVFNTLFALPSQDRQVTCVGNVARRLRPGGMFVVEAFVPDRARFARPTPANGRPRPPSAPKHDPVTQTVDGLQTLKTGAGVRIVPFRMRYAWPAELDLMARLAGLQLRQRFGGWDREPFTAMSDTHVSVYAAPPVAA
jgi:SAM-dependent methyltransferase